MILIRIPVWTVNCVDKISQSSVFSIGDSDHHALYLHKDSKDKHTYRRTSKKRVYKNFNKDNFVEDLSKAKQAGLFKGMYETTDLDEAVAQFNKVFTNLLDTHAPIKIIQHHKNYVPYLTKELKDKMKYRDKLKKSLQSNKDEEIHTEYKKLRNQICSEIKEAKLKQ